MQFPEHVLGHREVGGREPGGFLGVTADDRFGQGGVLVQRPAPDRGGVGLGVEAEAHLPPDACAQLDQPRVVGRVGDRLVQGGVGKRILKKVATSN